MQEKSVDWQQFLEALEGFEFESASFDLFEAIHCQRKERTHTAVLAYFLDPSKPHGLEDNLLRKLVDELRVLGSRCTTFLADNVYQEKILVNTEWQQIDVTVRFGGRVAIGIEAKIDAEEGTGQIARYQARLAERYPERSVLVFLTLSGQAPITVNKQAECKCISLPWRKIAGWLEEAVSSSGHERISSASLALVQEWTRTIRGWTEVMSKKEAEQIRKILSDQRNLEVLGKIDKARLVITDHKEKIRNIVQKVLADIPNAEGLMHVGEISTYGTKEVSVPLKIAGTDSRFFLLFYYYPEENVFPGMLVLIDDQDKIESRLIDPSIFASQDGLKIAGELKKPERWSTVFKTILEGDDYVPGFGLSIKQACFDEHWEREAERQVERALVVLAAFVRTVIC